MLLGISGAGVLANILAGKRMNRAGEEFIRTGYGSSIKNKDFSILPHPLTIFEIQNYYQNEPTFNGVCSGDNLPDEIKDGANVINLDEYFDIETHWIALYASNNNVTYFDSFGVEHIPNEINVFIDKSIVLTNIFRIQAFDSVGIRSASFSLAFPIFTGTVKKLFKTTRNKKKRTNIVMLVRSKLNSIESKISEALINSEISHEDFIRELKESVRMMNSQ